MSNANPENNTIVTRFAPSPTGYLHVGGARTALFSWLLARHHGGRFLLRIEDTDLARSTEQAAQQLLEDLRWLGLHWDNAELVYQSRRLDTYNRIIDDLLARGLAYEAWETSEELDQERKAAEREKRPFIYRRREYGEYARNKFEGEGRRPVVRLAVPVKEYRFRDEVLGKDIVVGPEQVQDFVIRKTDGMPTFHFAVVVDDAEMGVTHILRGQEHTLNTINHIALQDALGYKRPVYGHLPIILNPDGSKMGKRDKAKAARHAVLHADLSALSDDPDVDPPGEAIAAHFGVPVQDFDDFMHRKRDDVEIALRIASTLNLNLPEIDVHDFRKNGYLPEVLLNFLALLGWNPGGDKERMTIGEMVALFDISGIGKANAKFARDKLVAFNTQAAEEASADRLVPALRDYLSVNPESPLNRADDADLAKLLQMKKGFRLLRDVDDATRFFYVPSHELTYDPAAVEKVLKKNDGEGLRVLRDVRKLLNAASEWTAHALEAAVKAYCETTGLGLGKVAQPLRVAISGGTVSPPIFESLEFLGKDRTLTRVERCLQLAAA